MHRPPRVDIVEGPDHARISKVTGFDTATVRWRADQDFQQYRVVVVTDTGHGRVPLDDQHGSQNIRGRGDFKANEIIETTVVGGDLEAASAEGKRRIAVMVRNAQGWSDPVRSD